MKKSRFKKPYTKTGKTNYPEAQKKSGIYLIKSDRTEKIVYVGYSTSDLYKTMYRHFQTWNDKLQERKVYNKTGYKVRVVLTTPKKAEMLEKALILKYKPKDNKYQYEVFVDENIDEKKLSKIQNEYFDTPATNEDFWNLGDAAPF